MIHKPRYITFTGVDEATSITEMCHLSNQYPIEWGILFSPQRQGQGRYPKLRFIEELVSTYGLDFSAHLCGADSRAVLEHGESQHDRLIRDYFMRAQINTADPEVSPTAIALWAHRVHIGAILQCRGEFPKAAAVSWLFDASGGRGITPSAWPTPIAGRLCGYAGGLKPDNVSAAVSVIGEMTDNYWLDMESGVRDSRDRFDLSLCRKVCEAVYGAGQ